MRLARTGVLGISGRGWVERARSRLAGCLSVVTPLWRSISLLVVYSVLVAELCLDGVLVGVEVEVGPLIGEGADLGTGRRSKERLDPDLEGGRDWPRLTRLDLLSES